ncbi:MAG: carboxypeptidase regulatory-like domain-containing protein, partial [Arenimonas sp.]
MTNHNRVRISKLAIGLAIALAAAPAFAQNTTSALGGRISTAGDKSVTGAEVVITHVESGSVSRTTTDDSGRFIARGLRVGGPYTVTITKDGQTTKRENVYLELAETTSLNASLDSAATTTLAAVEVKGVAGGSAVFSSTAMGTGSSISRQQIESLPSATGNIQDYIRLDPRVSQVSKADGAISAGGQNTRYNLIKIDGVSASDPFGLESNNLPTERQPVSMDAIQAIKIALADYDVTIAGGTGAVINAVTKSGTNDFKGSLYYSLRDGDWVRQDLRGVKFNGWGKETTFGGTFGGPILEDKLFFFANYEKYVRTSPGVSLGETPYGAGDITDADISRLQAAAATYGFEAGGLSSASANTEVEEYAVKIDWNINDSHRAALRHSKTEQSVVRFPKLDNNSISLDTFWYALPKTFDSTVLELFSDWSDSFTTEFKASSRDYSAIRATNSNLPQIEIQNYPGRNSIFIGTEQNSHRNEIDTKQFSLFGAANWYVGDHTVKFGFDYEKNEILNFFGRNINGVYTFDSIGDFENNNPARYIVRVPLPGGSLADIPAAYDQKNTAAFVQDTWAVNYNLTLNFGLRYDRPSYSEQTLDNSFIEGIYGYDNTQTIKKGLFQPRAGFNYTFDSDRPTQLRGGLGLFQGASPNVWVAGTYQNTGLNYLEFDLRNPGPIFTPNVDPPFTPAPNPACFPTPTLASCARQNVDIVEPGLAQPSSWKANLAFEHETPFDGIVFSAEWLHTKVKDSIFIERLDLFDAAGNGPTRIGPDGRMMFWRPGGYNPTAGSISFNNANANQPIGVGTVNLLRNSHKGYSNQLTVGLERPMKNDWSWTFAYTFTEAEEVSPLTSSINSSNWNNTLIYNVNEDIAKKSRYAIRDRFTGTLNWQHAFFGDYMTRVGLVYEGRTGRPYSYIFRNDMNGDGQGFNDLFYVPNGPGDVVFTGGAAMESAFFTWLNANPELARYAGQVAPANAFNAKWVNSFDVRLTQELPGFAEGHKTKLTFDLMNVGNLLNKKWGLIDDFGFNSTSRVASYSGICGATVTALCPAGSEGRLVYNFNSADLP